jgi:hypothetical protein
MNLGNGLAAPAAPRHGIRLRLQRNHNARSRKSKRVRLQFVFQRDLHHLKPLPAANLLEEALQSMNGHDHLAMS